MDSAGVYLCGRVLDQWWHSLSLLALGTTKWSFRSFRASMRLFVLFSIVSTRLLLGASLTRFVEWQDWLFDCSGVTCIHTNPGSGTYP